VLTCGNCTGSRKDGDAAAGAGTRRSGGASCGAVMDRLPQLPHQQAAMHSDGFVGHRLSSHETRIWHMNAVLDATWRRNAMPTFDTEPTFDTRHHRAP